MNVAIDFATADDQKPIADLLAGLFTQAFYKRLGFGHSAMRVLRKTVTGSDTPVTPNSS